MPSPQTEIHHHQQQQITAFSKGSNEQVQVAYLQSLKSIRDRCELVYSAVKSGHPESRFEIDETRLDYVAEYVAEIIKKDYADPKKDIPPHSRWRHFLPSGSIESSIIEPLKLTVSTEDFDEIVTKSLLDLFVVSVLLDAGAGDKWKYKRGDLIVGRSEGLAMASMDMFINGSFSSSSCYNFKVDADALINLTESTLSNGLQVDPIENPLIGLKGRLDLLKRLGHVLKDTKNQKFFYNPKDSSYRPGNLIYFLRTGGKDGNKVEIEKLWQVVIEGFGGVWPEEGRIKIGNVCLGDVWRSRILENYNESINELNSNEMSHDDNLINRSNSSNTNTSNPNSSNTDNLVTFHKLSQWLTYSLLEPMEMFLKIEFINKEQMTGLAEYRNGGLFIDLNVLKIKKEFRNDKDEYRPDDEVIIQWRALTICLLDRLAPLLRSRLQVTREEFSLPKMLEGGTWKAGRIVAKTQRPETCGPPIKMISDGTLF